SRTSSVARNPARSSGTGTSPLSMPQARPPGTPTTSCGPSVPNEPRGVVRRYGGPSSALADRPTTAIATSPITSETRFFDMPETVLDGPVRVCPQFVRSRRTFVRKPSHICAAPPSGELHDPGRDLIGREMGLREASINVQRSRGSDHVKPVVPKADVALAEIDGTRGTDGPIEAEGAGHLLTFRVRDPHDEGSVRPRAKRGHHERRGRIDERHEGARATIPQNGDRDRQPLANDPCRPCDIDL